MPNPEKIQDGLQKCKTCGKEFEAYHYAFGGAKVLVTTHCKECDDKEREKIKREDEAFKKRQVDQLREVRLKACNIPPRYETSTFDSFADGWQDKAKEKCLEYANEYPVGKIPRGYKSLYLWSSTSWGTGKTHLVTAICHRILERWIGEGFSPNIIFMSEPELFRRIQATYSYDYQEQRTKESESDIINQIASAHLVVLDDVGKEPRSDMRFVRRTLFAIINARYDNDLPLIITANLKPMQLKEHLDEPPTEASFNRFISMIKQKHIHMDGKSYRRNVNG